MVVRDVGDIKGLDSIEKKLNWGKTISIFFLPRRAQLWARGLGPISRPLGTISQIASVPRKAFT